MSSGDRGRSLQMLCACGEVLMVQLSRSEISGEVSARE